MPRSYEGSDVPSEHFSSSDGQQRIPTHFGTTPSATSSHRNYSEEHVTRGHEYYQLPFPSVQGPIPYHAGQYMPMPNQPYLVGYPDSPLQRESRHTTYLDAPPHHLHNYPQYAYSPAPGYQGGGASAIPYQMPQMMPSHHQSYWHSQESSTSKPLASNPHSNRLSTTTTTVPSSHDHRRGRRISNSPTQPCGPPTKPKQSGFALWVGNLPPGVAIIDVKDYFAQGAKDDIQSVRLISKSNCAFVNYRTEAASLAAAQRFDGARMHGFRLSTRVRNTSTNATKPAEKEMPRKSSDFSHTDTSGGKLDREAVVDGLTDAFAKQRLTSQAARYFILKSMTSQDIATSVATSRWSTQLHNEAVLDQAFRSSACVYLVFSINQSGEYAGYARMASVVEAERPVVVSSSSSRHLEGDDDRPQQPQPDATGRARSYSCASTEWAPVGHIVVDDARGTIFWEADVPAADSKAKAKTTAQTQEEKEKRGEQHGDVDLHGGNENEVESTIAGTRSFKVDWLCTTPLPFYKVGGLRNPLNSNRQIKIARDGQEVEASVGEQLVALFEGGGGRG